MNTLAMLSMVTAMVMMVIGNSIARAFSLVGALSIIRFRTAVKDTRDIAFVFLALAAGMAAGTTQPSLVIAIFLSVAVLVFVLHVIHLGVPSGRIVLLTLSGVPDELSPDVYLAEIGKFARVVSLMGIQTQKLGQLVEVSYALELRRHTTSPALVARLSALPGIAKVSLSPGEQTGEP